MRQTRRSKLAWYGSLLAIALVGGAWIHLTRLPAESADAPRVAPQVNFLAPSFSLPALDGAVVSSNDLRGRVVLVNVWATWCPPCRAEMPEIQAAYERYRSQGLVVVAINQGEDAGTVARFAEQFDLTFPILLDPGGTIGRSYQVYALPGSFFIDRDGMVRAKTLGGLTRAYIDAQLFPLLESQH